MSSPPPRPPSRLLDAFFASPTAVYGAAAALRLGMLVYGLWQDAVSPVKYTDVDYLVFTDAARFVAAGGSPYQRETYRYTPLLAWMLLPTTAWFEFGKVLFAAADVAAGFLLARTLRLARPGLHPAAARRLAAVWLLNPMVAAISTRGSSEGLLGVLAAALLWAVLRRRVVLAGLVLGLAVHFKIYPFIYAPAIVWWMDHDRMATVPSSSSSSSSGSSGSSNSSNSKSMIHQSSLLHMVLRFVTRDRLVLAATSLVTFGGLSGAMYALYGDEFVTHTYLHHVGRLDHRHNFSPYNTLLYLSGSSSSSSSYSSYSSYSSAAGSALPGLRVESLAFLPQLLLSTVLVPLALAKRDLPACMLAQTFAFVAFNKVCTSQYFLWYMVLLPLYLPRSSFLAPRAGAVALALWVAGQAAWLQQAYLLEFLGRSTFVPGLWLASLAFFAVNCWILGVVISDVARPDDEVVA